VILSEGSAVDVIQILKLEGVKGLSTCIKNETKQDFFKEIFNNIIRKGSLVTKLDTKFF
jgi:hypothetical protein